MTDGNITAQANLAQSLKIETDWWPSVSCPWLDAWLTNSFAIFSGLLKLFQKTWAKGDALHVEQAIELSGHTANWETVLHTAQTGARELFQPALLDLYNDVPLTLVLETLLDRLEASRK